MGRSKIKLNMLLRKVLLTILFVGVGTYFSEWLGANWLSSWNKIWVVTVSSVIAAVTLVFVDILSSNLEKRFRKPVLLIKTSKNTGEINITIDIRGSADGVSLNYPILGQVTSFQDLNSLTDARTVLAKVVGGDTEISVQNNLQIAVADIKPNIKLQYKIFYKPVLTNIMIAGMDKYEITYTWQYSGENIQETEWRMTENDRPTTKPTITVMGMEVFNKALSPEEIKKMYEDGPPHRNYQ